MRGGGECKRGKVIGLLSLKWQINVCCGGGWLLQLWSFLLHMERGGDLYLLSLLAEGFLFLMES